ncbi:MAG TPA: hypothetical protein VFJ14_14050, partial [Nocardioidaceae bacterium]|nr:hypothetical protein [Nocardioidaceae bacterium]
MRRTLDDGGRGEVLVGVGGLLRDYLVAVLGHDLVDVNTSERTVVDDDLDSVASRSVDVAKELDGGSGFAAGVVDVAEVEHHSLIDAGASGVPGDVTVPESSP